MQIILIFGWLKIAHLCKNPFDGDEHFDIDLEHALDGSHWDASVALQTFEEYGVQDDSKLPYYKSKSI